MKPFNLESHLSCKYFVQDYKCIFNTSELSPGETKTLCDTGLMLLVFIENGSIRYAINGRAETKSTEDSMLFIDKGDTLKIRATKSPVRISFFKFNKPTKLCENYSLTRLRLHVPDKMTYPLLPIGEEIHCALSSMIKYFNDGLRCGHILEYKLREIFFILSAYYSPDVLGKFMAPALKEEVSFKEFIMNNHDKVSTVQELAEMRNMSLRVFNKIFKDTFDTPPYQWMLAQKSKIIERKLAQKEIPFSDIIQEFNFSSPSHFTVYCRRQFGMPPSQKRRELIEQGFNEEI